ncbi:lanthionine synthetase C family protein [Flavobacterium sp.]|uniref:lanthionine synthetase C family protein n=1 Tax=Flavobacterium sp. TaxID=239 RepID=UPI0026217ED9|nr:lanthionine synthetase C family protein [Flavobacterium sp.]
MDLKNRSYQELSEIIDYIQDWNVISKEPNVINISLLSGLPGIILTLLDTNATYPELVNLKKIKSLIDHLLDILYKSENLLPSYCGGIAGLGFLLDNLKEQNVLYDAEYDDILEEIDSVLEDMFKVEIEEDNIDMLHGALGIGLYFIKRKNERNVLEIINFLEKTAIKKDNQIYWKVFDKHVEKDFFYDFGLAHGNAGILYFFLKCIKHNILIDKSKAMAREMIIFFTQNTQTLSSDIYSFYQYKIEVSAFDDSEYKPTNSRLAWCYGDLGILHTLLIASKILEDESLEKYAIEKLYHVSDRLSEREITKHDMDAGFCHGTGGVAFIFKNVYELTKDVKFLPTIDHWTKKTFEMKDIKSHDGFNILGYSFPVFEDTTQNVTFLEGLAGVAASNLKYLSKKPLVFIEEAVFLTV